GVGALALRGREEAVEISRPLYFDATKLQAQGPGCCGQSVLSPVFTCRRRICRKRIRHPRYPGDRLLQHFDELVIVEAQREPSEVSAGSPEAGDESACDRVVASPEHDRDCLRRI